MIHVVYYLMFIGEPELLSIIDSAWSRHDQALRRVAWIIAQGGEASIATRNTDDGELELGDADDAILAIRRRASRRKAATS